MFAPSRSGTGPLNNLSATTPPGTGNDSTQGYSIGSHWFNTTTGVMWFCRDASAGAAVWQPDSPHPGYIAGRPVPIFGGNTATNNIAADRIYMMPFVPEADITITGFGLWLVAGSGATGIKGAVYANRYSGTGKARAFGAPLVADNTGVATTASGAEVVITLAQALKRGVTYWHALKSNSGTPTFTCSGTTSLAGGRLVGTSSVSSANATSVSIDQAYATAFPTLDGSETWTDRNAMPVIYLKS